MFNKAEMMIEKQKHNNSTETAILPMQCYKPLHFAELFELHFLNDIFKTSLDNNIRDRYEVSMPEIDYWINTLGLNLSNDFDNAGQKFKTKLFYHLKNKGWKPTKIKGRWSKTVFFVMVYNINLYAIKYIAITKSVNFKICTQIQKNTSPPLT